MKRAASIKPVPSSSASAPGPSSGQGGGANPSGFNNSPQVEELRQQLLATLSADERKKLATLSNVSNTEKYEGQVDAQSRRHGKGILRWNNGNCYFGEWVDGSMSGRGTFLYGLEEDSYCGEFHDDKKHGRGKYVFANGNSYEGEFILDKRHGKGRYSWTCGDSYDGEWRDGRMHGFGITIYANGNRYEGNFIEDRREGEGKLVCTDGLSYAGAWLKNMRHGLGTLTFPSKDYYHGEWVNDKKHGRGKDVFVNGNEFDGMYSENEKCGFGTMRYANGDRYDGEWKADKMHGRGVYKFANGFEYDGEWQADTRHGHGVYKFPNGHVYDGQWRSDKRHGAGMLTLAPSLSAGAAGAAQGQMSSDRYVGSWIDGKMAGTFQVLRLPVIEGSGAVDEKRARKVYEGKWEAGVPTGEGKYHFRAADIFGSGADERVYVFAGKWNTSNAAKKSDGTVEFPAMLAECLVLITPTMPQTADAAALHHRDPLLKALVPLRSAGNEASQVDEDEGIAIDGHFAAAVARSSGPALEAALPPGLRQLLTKDAVARGKKAMQGNAQVLGGETERLRAILAAGKSATGSSRQQPSTADEIARARQEAADAESSLGAARAEHEALQHELLDAEKGTGDAAPEVLEARRNELTAEIGSLKRRKQQLDKDCEALNALRRAKVEAEKEAEAAEVKLAEAQEHLRKLDEADAEGDAAGDGESLSAAKARLSKAVAALKADAAARDAELAALQKQLASQGSEYRGKIKKLEERRAANETQAREIEKKIERATKENERLKAEAEKLAAAAREREAKGAAKSAARRSEVEELQRQLRDVVADTQRKRAELDALTGGASNGASAAGPETILGAAEQRRATAEAHAAEKRAELAKAALRRELLAEEIEELRAAVAEAEAAATERRATQKRSAEALSALQKGMDRELVALQAELQTHDDALRAALVEQEAAEAEAADAAARLGALQQQQQQQQQHREEQHQPPPVVVGRIRRTTSSLLGGAGAAAAAMSATADQPQEAVSPADAAGIAELRKRRDTLDQQAHEHDVAIAQLQRKKAQLDDELAAAKAAKKGAKKKLARARRQDGSNLLDDSGDSGIHTSSSAPAFGLAEDDEDDDGAGLISASSAANFTAQLRQEAGREALENQLRKARSTADALQRDGDALEARIRETRDAIDDVRNEAADGTHGGSGGGMSHAAVQSILASIDKDDWRLKYLADQVNERGRVLAQLERECMRVGQLEEQLAQVTQAIGALQSEESKSRMALKRPSSGFMMR